MNETGHNPTLESYENHLEAFIAKMTPVSGELKAWIDKSFSEVPVNSRVIEIGSGTGRDADYIESLGYAVERTDAANSFINYLKGQGHDVRHLNVLTDTIGNGYDVIFADAVMLHFTPEELTDVAHKIYRSLNEGGRFAFCLKDGEGEEWTENIGGPRFFHYWKQNDLSSLLVAVGFIEVEIASTVKDDVRKQPWLMVIAHK